MAANRLLGGGFRLLAGLKVTHASNRGSKGSMARPGQRHTARPSSPMASRWLAQSPAAAERAPTCANPRRPRPSVAKSATRMS